MSKRPIRTKQANKLRRVLRKGRLESKLDLRHWLQQQGHAQTVGQADALILAGRVKSESHVLGIAKGLRPKPEAVLAQAIGRTLTKDDFEEVDVVNPYVDAHLRETIQVHDAPSVDD